LKLITSITALKAMPLSSQRASGPKLTKASGPKLTTRASQDSTAVTVERIAIQRTIALEKSVKSKRKR
jgi:hypothetical protein